MQIPESHASLVSLPDNVKRTGKALKSEVQMGKVIAKSGKEIEVLINDKVYKIEPGNYQTIKIGDTIQVFFGKNIPSEISPEMLQKISGKLLDVFSLSLPFKTTQELENVINNMPQGERLQFARISNEITTLIESILSEDYGLQVTESAEKLKNAFDLFDPKLPFNRRLIELSLKIKSMGNMWEQLPDTIKKEIVKEYVLFDLKLVDKAPQDTIDTDSQLKALIKEKNPASLNSKPADHSKQIDIKSTESLSELKPDKQIHQQPDPVNKNDRPIIEDLKNNTPQKGQAPLSINKNNEQNQAPVEKKTTQPEKAQSNLKPNLLMKPTQKHTLPIQEGHIDSGKMLRTENKLDENQTQTKPLMKETSIVQKDPENIHTENSEKKMPIPPLSKEVFSKLTELLKNTLSKPVSVEKNHPALFKMDQAFDKVEGLSQRLNELNSNHNQINPEEKHILNALKEFVNLPNKDNSFIEGMVLNSDKYQTLLKSEITFEKVSQLSLMKFEINHMIKELQGSGIEKKDAFFFTNDMVNIASKTLNESDFSTQIYSSSIKKYLKYRLPQIIVDNKIERPSENKLIEKVEQFSKKTFMIIKTHIEKLVQTLNNRGEQQKTVRQEASDATPKKGSNSLVEIKEESSPMKTTQTREPVQTNNQQKELPRENNINTLDMKKNEISENTNEKKTQSTFQSHEPIKTSNNQSKTDGLTIPTKEIADKVVQEGKEAQTNTKQIQVKPNVEIYSEKMLKLLNLPVEKQDFNSVYSSVIHLYEQNFSIDFQQQKTENSGYDKKEMYRVFIETNTQLFGTVFVDTVVSGKNMDIYIYADNLYAKEFTNHSALLTKRLKETQYDLRSLLIRESIDHNEILKHKVKLYTNPSEKGGFFGLA